MIISISGRPGSGKSTVAKMLAKKLGWPRYYIGGIRRKKAEERGLTLAEYNKLGETDPATDREVDEYQKHLGETGDNFIIEGRTSWHFIPHAVKIYLDVDEKEGARRIRNDLLKKKRAREYKQPVNLTETMKSIKRREKSDVARYKQYYGIDTSDIHHHDFILDTTNLDVAEVFQKVYEYVEKCFSARS